MCVTPQAFWSDRKQAFVPARCRKCWRCKMSKTNDLIGRALVEKQTAKMTMALTLTYGGDTVNSCVLVYKDFQDFMKRVRKKYGKTRFMVGGEYGSENGRAHWHCALFFYENYPELPIEQDYVEWPTWGQGFVYRQHVDFSGFYYIMKYYHKDEDAIVSLNKWQTSTDQPIGYQGIMDMADRYIEDGIVPYDWTYQLSSCRKRTGELRKFYLEGVIKDQFYDRFYTGFVERWGREPKINQFLEDIEDKREFEEMKADGYIPGKLQIAKSLEKVSTLYEDGVRADHPSLEDPQSQEGYRPIRTVCGSPVPEIATYLGFFTRASGVPVRMAVTEYQGSAEVLWMSRGKLKWRTLKSQNNLKMVDDNFAPVQRLTGDDQDTTHTVTMEFLNGPQEKQAA